MTASGIQFIASNSDIVLREVLRTNITTSMKAKQNDRKRDAFNLLAPIQVVVPNEGMREELLKYFARHPEFRTTTLVDLIPASKWMETWLNPKTGGYTWDENTTWTIWHIFQEGDFCEQHAPLKSLLSGDNESVRTQSQKTIERFELAQSISELFFRYLSFRLDWVLAWLVSDQDAYDALLSTTHCEVEHADVFKAQFDASKMIPEEVRHHPHYAWQRELFLKLAKGHTFAVESYEGNREVKLEWPAITMLRLLMERLGLFTVKGGASPQPHEEDMHFFMPTSFPPTILPYLKSVLKQDEPPTVHAYLHSPCMDESWIHDAMVSHKHEVELNTLEVGDDEPMPETVEEPVSHAMEGNTALPPPVRRKVTWGRVPSPEWQNPMLARNAKSHASILYRWHRFMHPDTAEVSPILRDDPLISKGVAQALDALRLDTSVQASWDHSWCAGFNPPPQGTLLYAMRQAILTKQAHIEYTPKKKDDSFMIVDAPTVMREVETVIDIILSHLNDQDNPCNPEDIMVVMPDPASRRPTIERMLKQAQGQATFPYRFKGEAEEEIDKAYEAMIPVLNWRYDRLDRADLIEWLNLPLIMERYKLDLESINLMVEWLDGAGFRFGLDPASVKELEGQAYQEEADMTLTRAVDRLLLARILGDTAEPLYGLLPTHKGDGFTKVFDRPDVLDTLLLVVDDLLAMHAMLPSASASDAEKSVQAWQDHLMAVLDFLTSHKLEEGRDMRRRIARFIRGVTRVLGEAGVMEGPLVLKTVAYPELKNHVGRGMGDAVTFTDMKTYQGVSKKVVIVMGLDQGARFPGQMQTLPYDLMPAKWRVGDRDSRLDERNQFLDAMLGAQQHLVLSFVSGTQLTPMPPSLVLDEVKTWIRDNLGEETLASLIRRVPLSSWNKERFQMEAGRLQSFNHLDREIMEALHDGQRGLQAIRPFVFLDTGWPEVKEEKKEKFQDTWYTVTTVQELARWLGNPLKESFKQWSMSMPEEIKTSSVGAVMHPLGGKGLLDYELSYAGMNAALEGQPLDEVLKRVSVNPRLGVQAWREQYHEFVSQGYSAGQIFMTLTQHPVQTMDLAHRHQGILLKGKVTIYANDDHRYLVFCAPTGITGFNRQAAEFYLCSALAWLTLKRQGQALFQRVKWVLGPDPTDFMEISVEDWKEELVEEFVNCVLERWDAQHASLDQFCMIADPSDNDRQYLVPGFEWLTQSMDKDQLQAITDTLKGFTNELKEMYLKPLFKV